MLKTLVSLLLTLLIGITTYAQKPPNKQETSIWASANIKIDGKAAEWGGKFQAFNNATDIFYTMANDDRVLYLDIQTSDADIIERIIQGGVTLSVQAGDKKDNKNEVAVTFPVPVKGDHVSLSIRDNVRLSKDSNAKIAATRLEKNNATLRSKLTQVAVTTGKVTDTLSVYNEMGVRVACSIDVKYVYTQQLAIPLNVLGITGATIKFNYNIRLNGSLGMKGFTFDVQPGDPSSAKNIASADRLRAMMNERVATLSAVTDFSGGYTLAKKP